MDVEDDVAVVFGRADPRQRRMSGRGAVELQPPEAAFQIARVGEGEGFRDLDDQAPFHEFHPFRVAFGVLELCFLPGHLAEDLYSRLGGVADDGEEGQADPESDAEGEGVEDCGEEDEGHEDEFGVCADMDEEGNVVGGFFDQGVGNYRDHGGEDGFLHSSQLAGDFCVQGIGM